MMFHKTHCPACQNLLSKEEGSHYVKYECKYTNCSVRYLYLEIGKGGAIPNNLVEFNISQDHLIQFNSNDNKFRWYKYYDLEHHLILTTPYFKLDWHNVETVLQRLNSLLVFL